jgi:hypothetical protein
VSLLHGDTSRLRPPHPPGCASCTGTRLTGYSLGWRRLGCVRA